MHETLRGVRSTEKGNRRGIQYLLQPIAGRSSVQQLRGAFPDARAGYRSQHASLEQRKGDSTMNSKKRNITIGAALALAFVLALGVGPVFAVDEVEYFCDGTALP